MPSYATSCRVIPYSVTVDVVVPASMNEWFEVFSLTLSSPKRLCELSSLSPASLGTVLDNDLIRLNQKVNTVLTIRGKMIESDRVMETAIVEAQANAKFHDAMDEADNIKNKK